MNRIHVLDQETIDRIAAGEAVERPASVAKELIENAIDAGSTRITIELRNGGIGMLRVTDNGRGISKEDIPLAFLRHATSKITKAEDLSSLGSLGFRGEALSSISAVAKVELVTKRSGDLTASRYVIEGGREKVFEEIGAPDGTTIVVRDLFYNTPARAKFLKTPTTEAANTGSFVEQLILSNPDIAFTLIVNGQRKLASPGNGKLADAIYGIYGREVFNHLVPVEWVQNAETTVEQGQNEYDNGTLTQYPKTSVEHGQNAETAELRDQNTEAPSPGRIRITGMIGKPQISRSNRNMENYYVNGRYVKSKVVSRAIEDGYSTRLMQHQYPFTCLMIQISGSEVDVNVHPTKMEVRFSSEKEVYEAVRSAVSGTLANLDQILLLSEEEKEKVISKDKKAPKPVRPAEPFEVHARDFTRARRAEEMLKNAQLNDTEEQPLIQAEGQSTIQVDEQPIIRTEEQPLIQVAEHNIDQASARPGENQESRDIRKETRQELQHGTSDQDFQPEIQQELQLQNRQGEDQILQSEFRMDEQQITQSKIRQDIQPEFRQKLQQDIRSEEQPEILQESQSDVSPQGRPQLRPENAPEYSQKNAGRYEQQSFLPRFLSEEAKPNRRIVGQLFSTYWICEYRDQVFVFDQHAAHERVLFEKFMKAYEKRENLSEQLMPPMIVTLNAGEEALLLANMDVFSELGFEIEHFGERDYAIRAVPYSLGTIRSEVLFRELLDQLEVTPDMKDMKTYIRKVATEACKAAVKGGGRLSETEAQSLLDDLMHCEDPYHCPHGRPTIISFTEKEIEKRFRRIV